MSEIIKCDKKANYRDCELAILRSAVDQADIKMKKRVINSPEIKKMIQIVEQFIRRKKLICYGGQGINEELPDEDKFYDKEVDLPDYDFFSPHALEDAKELTDLYYKSGFAEVEAKSAQHHGSYKIFVNFIPMADITQIHHDLYKTLKRDAILVHGIYYAPPNYLRMQMYIELSRPAGYVGRWEKVAKRLSLLNKNYPLTEKQCSTVDFQRRMVLSHKKEEPEIYDIVKDTLIEKGAVLFGGFAIANYAQYMPQSDKKQVKHIADFDAIVKDPAKIADKIRQALYQIGVEDVTIKKRPAIDEIIPEQMEIDIGGEIVAVLYPPMGCHSYNTLNGSSSSSKIRIATIDTMLSFYLAFIYANKPYFDPDRILCMAKYLYDVQQKNLLEQKGLLRRFTITCYGRQPSVDEMRAEKAQMFKKLQGKRGTRIYEEWFLNYRPYDDKVLKPKKTNWKKTFKDSSLISSRTRSSRTRSSRTRSYSSSSSSRSRSSRKLFDPYGALKK